MVVVGIGAVTVLDVDVELDEVEEDVEVVLTVELVGRVDDELVELVVVDRVVEELVLVVVLVLLVEVLVVDLVVEELVLVVVLVDVLVVGTVDEVVVDGPAPGGTSVRHSPSPATPL